MNDIQRLVVVTCPCPPGLVSVPNQLDGPSRAKQGHLCNTEGSRLGPAADLRQAQGWAQTALVRAAASDSCI